MPTRIADQRDIDAMTDEQADELFAELAMADIRARKAQAAAEKKIADVKARCQEETEEDRQTVKRLAEQLAQYVMAHRGRFVKPRQRKTPYGKYGLRTATRLQVADEEALVDLSNERGLGLTTVAVRLDKGAVAHALGDGIDLQGLAEIVCGDIASYDIDRRLLNS